jgi:formylglycine-generating enzyme required for sulfatase activity
MNNATLIFIFSAIFITPFTCFAEQSKSSSDQFVEPTLAMEFVKIPGGCFQMGSLETRYGRGSDEGPVHEVCLDTFWMGKYEVTWDQWKLLMPVPENCSYSVGKENFPSEGLTWDEAHTFITKMNNTSNTKKFRLPSEAEWEYATKAGKNSVYSFGNTIDPDIVNYDGKYPFGKVPKGLRRQAAERVGSFPGNSFGLHDMHGNVWEYCNDWYDEQYYANSPKMNPKGPENGVKKVIRGGSWDSDARNCRSSERAKYKPNSSTASFGFRLVFSDQ